MKKYILPLILILCLAFTLIGYSATYTSQYPTHDTDHVKATTNQGAGFLPHLATDPALSLTGANVNNAWYSQLFELTEQRFHIDLGSAMTIRRIYYENSHDSGAETDRGAENFTFWGSNTGAGTFDDLVYANDEGWTELTCAQNTLDEHIGADQADPKYITVTNVIAYRYYAFKFADTYGGDLFMGVRIISLQTEDGWTPPAEGIEWNGVTITKWNGVTITIPLNTQ